MELEFMVYGFALAVLHPPMTKGVSPSSSDLREYLSGCGLTAAPCFACAICSRETSGTAVSAYKHLNAMLVINAPDDPPRPVAIDRSADLDRKGLA